MNERIKELAEQATTYIDPIANDGVCWDFNKEKFAQLIVFECTKAVQDGTKEGDHYAQRIEQHFNNSTGGILDFGVEE